MERAQCAVMLGNRTTSKAQLTLMLSNSKSYFIRSYIYVVVRITEVGQVKANIPIITLTADVIESTNYEWK
jgi:hypothetical protein